MGVAFEWGTRPIGRFDVSRALSNSKIASTFS
jgi:hypothetical protein